MSQISAVRLYGATDHIKDRVKDIQHHLGKPPRQIPWDDVAILLNEIRQTAAVMLRRVEERLP
jgi:hypothetical protein